MKERIFQLVCRQDMDGLSLLLYDHVPRIVHRRSVPQLPSRILSAIDSMIAIERGSTDSIENSIDTIHQEKRKMLVGKREGGGDDGQSILIVHTYRYVFVLDTNEKQGSPVLIREIDLFKHDFPLAMGMLKLENKVYMFGGSDDRLMKEYRDSPESSYNPFVFELSSKLGPDMDTWFLNCTFELDSTRDPKVFPCVAYADDKILVLDSQLGCKGNSPHYLEFYDLPTKTWKEFPAIPTQDSWSKEEEDIITSRQDPVFVSVGHKLYIRFGSPIKKLYFCLNTRTQEWDMKSASNFCESLHLSPLHFPRRGTCISGIDGLNADQNIILKLIGRKIHAYLIDDSGYLLCYQDLTYGLCRDIINPCYLNGILFIDRKKGGGVCMVLIDHQSSAEYGFFVEQSIFIRHVELKLKKGVKVPFKKMYVPGGRVRNAKFLNVEIIKNQQFTVQLKDRDLHLYDAVLI